MIQLTEVLMSDKVLSLKVAARYAARPMKEEKVKALLMKLRKGSGTGLKGAELEQVLLYLGGWRIEETKVWVPEGGRYVPKDEPKTYSNSHPGNVKTTWDSYKDDEVQRLPDAESQKVSARVYMDVGEIRELPNGWTGFDFRGFRVDRGMTVTSPEGKSWEKGEDLEQFRNGYPSNSGLLKWVTTETSFLKQVSEKLDLPTFEKEREDAKRNNAPRTRNNTGTCPACFNNVKLVPKAKKGSDKSLPGMTLHGYKRPGLGYLHSNCFGELWPPFELSSEGTFACADSLEKTKRGYEEHLGRLRKGGITSIITAPGSKPYVKEEMGPKEWDKVLNSEIDTTERIIHSIESDIVRLRRHGNAWKLEPLPMEGEEIKLR